MEIENNIERIELSDKFDNEALGDLKDRLVKATAESKDCELDLVNVSNINTVFIQLIIACKISLNVEGKDLILKNTPSKLIENFTKLGLNNLIINEDKING